MSLQAFELLSLDHQNEGKKLYITPQFQLNLTQKVIDAIDNGIVITFVYQAKLYQNKNWWFDHELESKLQTFQVRYFSLLRQFQLRQTQAQGESKFVSLNQLLTHVGQETTFEFKSNPAADYIETRIFLDKQALPSIMQLPHVFDADWNLNSDWQTIPLESTKGLNPQP